MNPLEFLDNFGAIANAPGGVKKLREMILQLAVIGKLVEEKIVHFADLAELGDWAIGSGFPIHYQGHINKPILYCKVSDMNLSGNEEKILTTANTIDEQMAKKIGAKIHPKGTVIFPKIGGAIATNKRRIIDKPTAIDNNCVGLIPKDGITTDWLFLILRSIDMAKYQTGTSVPSLSQKKLGRIRCAKPPLAEQHRIVEKVEQLMSLCDQLEAQQKKRSELIGNTRKTALDALANASGGKELKTAWRRIEDNLSILFENPEDVEDLKKCVLQNAIMGKLVQQNPKDEPASVLLKKIAAEKAELVKKGEIKKEKPLPEIREDEKPFAIPQGWEWCRFGILSLLITSGSRDWAKYYSATGAAFIRMGNLSRNSFKMRLSSIQRVSPPPNGEGERTSLKPNDLLISITGEVGMLGLIPDGLGEAYINQHTAVVRPSKEIVHFYLPYFCLSPFAQCQFNAPQRGIKNSFRLSDVAEMVIPLPPYQEQNRIIAKAQLLLAHCDLLQTQLTKAQKIAENLVQSIVESITGITTEKQDKMKVPKTEVVSRLVLAKTPKTKDNAPLSTILANNNNELSAKALWSSSGLPIDQFYKQLKTEMVAGWIVEPKQAEVVVIEE